MTNAYEKGLQLMSMMNDMPEELILESDITIHAPYAHRPQSAFSRFINSGWGVAILCLIVSLSVVVGLVYMGQNAPPVVEPPVGDTLESEISDTDSESESDEITDIETDEHTETGTESETLALGMFADMTKLEFFDGRHHSVYFQTTDCDMTIKNGYIQLQATKPENGGDLVCSRLDVRYVRMMMTCYPFPEGTTSGEKVQLIPNGGENSYDTVVLKVRRNIFAARQYAYMSYQVGSGGEDTILYPLENVKSTTAYDEYLVFDLSDLYDFTSDYINELSFIWVDDFLSSGILDATMEVRGLYLYQSVDEAAADLNFWIVDETGIVDVMPEDSVPANTPALMWDASKQSFGEGPMGKNLSFEAQPDYAYRVTASSRQNYFDWIIRDDLHYDGKDFPVLAMFVRELWCNTGNIYYCAGPFTEPKPGAKTSWLQYHKETQFYLDEDGGEDYALIFVDLSDQWSGRIHQLRIGFEQLEMAIPEFDILYMGLFRSKDEAIAYTDARYAGRLSRDGYEPPETETETDHETETETEIQPDVETTPWYNLWTTNRQADEIGKEMYRPAAGYRYTDRGFEAIGADFTGTNPYLNIQSQRKVNIKEGIYLQIAVTDFSYRGLTGQADEWISFNIWTEPSLSVGTTGYGQGYLNLLRSTGNGSPAMVENYLASETTFSNTAIGPNVTPRVDLQGREVWTFEVRYSETTGYSFVVNDIVILQKDSKLNASLEAMAPDGMFYVGVALHSTEPEGTAAANVLKFGHTADDALVPTGDQSASPEANPWDRSWNFTDPSTVPVNTPALMWDASKQSFVEGPNGTNLTFEPQADNSYHVTASSNINYFTWVVDDDLAYDGHDFPILAIFVKNLWCNMGNIYHCAGDITAPSPMYNAVYVQYSQETQFYWDDRDQEYALIFVDLYGRWSGRIHQLRIGFDQLDMAMPEFDIMYMGLFRSVEEATNYTDNRYKDQMWRDGYEPPETETETEPETEPEPETVTYTVTVTDPNGIPLSGVAVQIFETQEGGTAFFPSVTNNYGMCAKTLKKGSYAARVSRSGYTTTEGYAYFPTDTFVLTIIMWPTGIETETETETETEIQAPANGKELLYVPAVDVPESKGLTFTSNEDGTCYLSNMGTCIDLVVKIPSVSPEGETVVAIGDRALNHNRTLLRVILPDGVKSIGISAFEFNSELQVVEIPDSVVSIGASAFSGCTALHQVTLPSQLTRIEEECFESCGLTSINIPQSVIYIGKKAFWSTALVDVVIPEGVTVLSDSLFEGCFMLETLTLGANLTIIEDYALENCPELREVIFKGTVVQWEAIQKGKFFVYTKAHITVRCTDGETTLYKIPEGWQPAYP